MTTRPPFPPGNTLALVHGATSPRAVAPLAQQIETTARQDTSWPAFLDDPAYGHAVAAWARAEAVAELLWVYLAERDLATALDEVTTDESDEQRSKGRTTRSSTSRRTTAALAAWQKAESAAAGHRQRLGLDPMSRARLGKDVAVSAVQAGLAQLQQDGAALVAKARAAGALAEAPTEEKR